MNKIKALAGGIILAGAGFAGLTACTTATPALSECAMVTNGGFGATNQGIVSVVHPGQQVTTGGGDTAWYYPCNARNYVTATVNGDRSKPEYAVRTAGSGTGDSAVPGMPVYVWTSVYFTPNQDDAVMKKFLPFCLKYGCATNDPQSNADIASAAHSSSPGWENMLNETMAPAVDRASQQAVAQFGPELWRDQADWNKLGDLIAQDLPAQLAKIGATDGSRQFFCGDTSPQGQCQPVTVVVSNVTPQDSAVVNEYNQQVAAEQAQQANAARLKAAQELYGNQANYWLGVQDAESNCKSCTIYVGTPGSVPAGK